MFSVTANSDVHTATLSSCDAAQEAGLFRQLELVYQTENSVQGDCHHNKTGYFWTVCELPELKHSIKTGQYTGEAANFGNWCLWIDALSATNHWLIRFATGLALRTGRTGRTLSATAWWDSSLTAQDCAMT